MFRAYVTNCRLTSSICLTPIALLGIRPLELGLFSSLTMFAFTGELFEYLSPLSRSTLLLRLCRALSTFLSRNRSCSRLATDPVRAGLFDRGRCADGPLMLEGVIAVLLEEPDSGRLRLDP